MSSKFASLIDQHVHIVPSFTLECGTTLRDVPVAYKTWGTLNDARDNVMIICHAFTGSADVEDWWGPMMGRGKAFDPYRFFVVCANVLGSPYGSASPITTNPDTGKLYGPEFPPTTIRDDVRIHKLVLDSLSVTSVAVAIGGSMGGMAVLEWPLCTPPNYVRHIIPLATSARHSAWCISWGEAQRQSIYSDPAYQEGYYCYDENGEKPEKGLAAARMSALLTYRSRDSFESRFGRKAQARSGVGTPPQSATAEALAAHNDGSRSNGLSSTTESKPPLFSAQSYLRYQGDKFTARFDANCYIHITRKMDTHDLARGRFPPSSRPSSNPDEDILPGILHGLPPSLIISIATDGLFTPFEQTLLSQHIPSSELVVIPSPDGHDGFLLEFEAINTAVLKWLKKCMPQLYVSEGEKVTGDIEDDGGFEVKKSSLFGEAEKDITSW